MSKYETPDYEVILTEDDIEIRQYNEFDIVEYTGSLSGDSGFRNLFSYISDDNEQKQKISMTIPVIQQKTKNNKTMAFVVPEKFKKDVPKPNNPNIKVKTFESGLFAVIKYSGFATVNKEMKMQEKLDKWISEKDYKKLSDYIRASYNAPMTLPMFRRNEVWIRVSKN